MRRSFQHTGNADCPPDTGDAQSHCCQPDRHRDTKAVERDADDGGWERAARTVE